MRHREFKRALTCDLVAVIVLVLMFVAAVHLVPVVAAWLPGGPLLWLGLWLLAAVFAVALCMAAARGDRQADEAYRRRDKVSLADQDGSQSGTADRGVASSGLGPAFHLSPGRSGRPSSRRPRR